MNSAEYLKTTQTFIVQRIHGHSKFTTARGQEAAAPSGETGNGAIHNSTTNTSDNDKHHDADKDNDNDNTNSHDNYSNANNDNTNNTNAIPAHIRSMSGPGQEHTLN